MEKTSLFSKFLPWVLFVPVIVLPYIAWSQRLNWNYSEVNAYLLFPLLGLWAWGIMWTHYAYGGLRLVNNNLQKNRFYSKFTGVLVLFLILMHPGLLALEQWENTSTLPPQSFYSYVASSQKLFVVFGSIALIIFLSFEVFERIKSKPLVTKNWKWISLSQVIAMTLIFIHAMAIGNTLNSGWIEYFWVMLGALLIPCFGLVLQADWRNK